MKRAPFRDFATVRVALRSLAKFSITRGGVRVLLKERRVREEMRMGVAWRERISVAKVCRLVVKRGREMFLAGFWSLWPNWKKYHISTGSWLFCLVWTRRCDGLIGFPTYLDRHKHLMRLSMSLDLFEDGCPVAALAEGYCCCAAVA